MSYNEKHWNNEQKTHSLLKKVIEPYVARSKEELGLAIDKKFLLIWDTFKGKGADATYNILEDLHIVTMMTPKT